MSRYERVCDDCGSDDFVDDWAAGDTICKSCGAVARDIILDERPSYNDYGAMALGSGGAAGYTAGYTGGYAQGDQGRSVGLSKRVLASTKREDTAEADRGNLTIASFAAQAKLPGMVIEAAKEVYADFTHHKDIGNERRPIYAACCLYLGSKICNVEHQGVGRMLSEIAAICNLPEPKLVKACKEIRAELTGKHYSNAIQDSFQAIDLIVRYVSSALGVHADSHAKARVISQASEIAKHTRGVRGLEGRQPRTICAAVVLAALQKENVKFTKQAVLELWGVSKSAADKCLGIVLEKVVPTLPAL